MRRRGNSSIDNDISCFSWKTLFAEAEILMHMLKTISVFGKVSPSFIIHCRDKGPVLLCRRGSLCKSKVKLRHLNISTSPYVYWKPNRSIYILTVLCLLHICQFPTTRNLCWSNHCQKWLVMNNAFHFLNSALRAGFAQLYFSLISLPYRWYSASTHYQLFCICVK